jgi:hypothetical protein
MIYNERPARRRCCFVVAPSLTPDEVQRDQKLFGSFATKSVLKTSEPLTLYYLSMTLSQSYPGGRCLKVSSLLGLDLN